MTRLRLLDSGGRTRVEQGRLRAVRHLRILMARETKHARFWKGSVTIGSLFSVAINGNHPHVWEKTLP